MTNLEALQSQTEYTNDNLFAKVIFDRNIDPSGVYAAANAQAIDLCLADVYFYLATHPDIREGAVSIHWTAEQLMEARRLIYDRWGLALPETVNAQNTPSVTGQPVTLGGKSYSAW